MILLQALPRDRTHDIANTIEEAVSIVISSCASAKTDRGKCTALAQGIFKFAIGVTSKMNEQDALKTKVLVLSLFPLFKDDNIINEAYRLRDEINDKELPQELKRHFTRINSFMDEMGKIEGKL